MCAIDVYDPAMDATPHPLGVNDAIDAIENLDVLSAPFKRNARCTTQKKRNIEAGHSISTGDWCITSSQGSGHIKSVPAMVGDIVEIPCCVCRISISSPVVPHFNEYLHHFPIFVQAGLDHSSREVNDEGAVYLVTRFGCPPAAGQTARFWGTRSMSCPAVPSAFIDESELLDKASTVLVN
ncbi:udp-glucoronosyl and udp-glucosyl transferase family protein [Moniliophthora roreri]|nr:udp-glucoronosyl and udp-glucosyl transferase family protein [Moniliophthora roreri]